MAKLGTKESGGYDPFNQISNQLAMLKNGEREDGGGVGTEGEGTQTETAPPPSAREIKPVPKPEVNAEPEARPAPSVNRVPRPAMQEWVPPATSRSGGIGAQGRGVSQGQTVPSQVALRITKRFKTTQEDANRHDQAVIRLAARLGTSMDFSKVTRALWEVYVRHEEEILRQIDPSMTWTRPANNDTVGLAELEDRLAEVIEEALLMVSMRRRNR